MTSGRVGRYASGVAIPRLQEPDDRGTRTMMYILDDQLGRCAGEERFAEVVGRITRHRVRFRLRHHNVTHSATQAGLSCPSTSMVKPTVRNAPACATLR